MKSTRNLLAAVLCGALLIGALGLTGCQSRNAVAKVNGETVSSDELNQQLEQLKKQYPNMFSGADGEGRLLDFKQRLLDNMINQILIEQAAEDQGIKISDADVDAQLKQLKSGFETQEKFEQKAATRASHILLPASDEATASKVLAEAKSGADFAALAKKYSTDVATKDKGGDLGWPTTPYVAEFEAALAKLKPGQVSALVKTQFGWHIIKATDTRKASTKKIAEVKSQIEQILVQQTKADAYQKYIENLRKDAKVTILVADLKTPAQSNEATKAK